MRIDILTLFPGWFASPLGESLLGKAVANGIVSVGIHDIRDHAEPPHRAVDDGGFGGGPGMVMMAEPVYAAVDALGGGQGRRVILLSPAGRRLDQALARELASEPWLVLICGRYEGVDERVVAGLPAEEVSIGDYVLSGGEAAAFVLMEAVTRLIPGVVGNRASLEEESFEAGILDHPHYTRPRELRGMAVPDVLLSGDHARIAAWRREAALRKTRANRPDLLRTLDGDADREDRPAP